MATTTGAGATFVPPNAMAIDAGGSLYVGGYFTSATVDFDPGTGTLLRSRLGTTDGYAWKLRSTGTL
ncbi:MAG TPA: hypothetical protein VEI97_05025 [bacterium]|nr:hypothetical protein [bacterium]